MKLMCAKARNILSGKELPLCQRQDFELVCIKNTYTTRGA